jgi:hypothetical protein
MHWKRIQRNNRYHRGQPFKGEPAFVWTVNGEKGELHLVSPAGPSLQANTYAEPVAIEVRDFETDEVTVVEWQWADWQLEIPVGERSNAALYEAVAEGDESKYATFEDALNRYEQLDKWLESFQY